MPSFFPHLTATGPPPNQYEVLDNMHAVFYARAAEGTVKPLVLPYHLYAFTPVLLYLCIDHRQRPWLYKARWVLLVAVECWQIKTMMETSSRSVANGFAAGLVAAWGMVWTATWLVFERPQWEGKRIKRRKKKIEGKRDELPAHHLVEDEGSAVGEEDRSVGDLRYRSIANGHGQSNGMNGHAKSAPQSPPRPSKDVSENADEWEYYWQPYPSTVSERISWVMELLLSFRVPGWNYAIPSLPPLSPSFKDSNGEPLFQPQGKSSQSTRNIQRSFQTRRELARYRVPRFIVFCFLIDLIKVIMMHDPYFLFGPTSYALPPHLVGLHPMILKLMRQFLGAVGVIVALELIFSIIPIMTLLVPYSWNLPLTLTPPYHPSTWGSASALLSHGLAGLWGTWWHQTFRFGFSAPYTWAVREGYITRKSITARLFALACAFGISGFLHASGSFTETSETKPFTAPVFFLLQAVGIILQTGFTLNLEDYIIKLPQWLRKAGNLLYILVWLHLTGSILIDDFSRCKLWLFEPLPVSLMRGLGFGVGEAGWRNFWLGRRWEPLDLHWYTGKHWWESGIAI